ncbi:LpxL/LpxP family acyltransferase [Azohydromonas aeria]|uniref:LpxL/LpxP family acyltransferase n=1 Tax=Azohydromonas aeria TaxID=2590212 RepID=UPI0012FCB897|nr:acyl-CoA synthetase [Azohydromonas aeria]
MSGDAPGTAPATWARAPERSNMLALRLMCWIAMRCGRRVARAVLHPIALYFLLFAPTARRHSLRYLGRALGRPARWADAYRHLHSFAATILDRVYLLRGRLDLFNLRLRGVEVIDQAMASGGGAFLVGAHLGSFEVLRAAGSAQGSLRVAMVMYPDNARKINAALDAVAPDAKPEIIALGRMNSMLAVRDWLDSSGLAGMLGDRVLRDASQQGKELHLSFLGREAVFTDGPFRLAALLRRRVIFMAGLYLGGNRYEVRFEPLADFTQRCDGAERERRIRSAVCSYVARLESLCREHPYNWFNFHDFWHED